MGCFDCLKSVLNDAKPKNKNKNKNGGTVNRSVSRPAAKSSMVRQVVVSCNGEVEISAKSYSLKELAIATQFFKDANLIGEGGFGKVYKGRVGRGQVVAVKKLNADGIQGTREFLLEALMLCMYRHPNLVDLVGFCGEGDEKLLVYEYMENGSLEDHLFDAYRLLLVLQKGLDILHDDANPPVIYRDMKAANVLLDTDFNPKLSDLGLAKLGPAGDDTHVSTRVMGTYGYCAPDYAMSGKLTVKPDIYSFGMLLLELITGRRAFDDSKVGNERSLKNWSRPFINDRRKFRKLDDPSLQGRFPPRAFHQLVVVSSMCLQEVPHVRPIIADVAIALNHIATQPYIYESEPKIISSPSSPLPSKQVIKTPARALSKRIQKHK